MSQITTLTLHDVDPGGSATLEDRRPGERYYRHPGDVVRLVVWVVATFVLILFISVATGTSDGVRTDLGSLATAAPRRASRELLLAAVQVGAVLVPVAILVTLAAQQRWRRAGTFIAAGALGVAVWMFADMLIDVTARVPGALDDSSWLISTRFPSLSYIAGASGVIAVGKPWMSRGWRRASDLTLVLLVVGLAAAGTAGGPELLLAVTAGCLAGSALLVAFGAPNRRPTPATVRLALAAAGVPVSGLELERAVGGRAQLYRVSTVGGGPAFVKVYGRDSHDADLLYRSYRKLVLRGSGDDWPAATLTRDVEHEALMLLLARRAGAVCPEVRAITVLADGSLALAMDDAGGRPLDSLAPEDIDAELLDAVFGQVALLHRAGLAHRSLRAANILVGDDGRPVVIDFGNAAGSASPRTLAMDLAELLASLTKLVGVEPVVAAAARMLDPDGLAATMPFLQPLGLSAATRHGISKSALKELREGIAAATEREPAELERLIRVKPRTVITIATMTGAFYVLLPQLANVDDSIEALGSANWAWLGGAVVMSGFTYIFSAVGMVGGVPSRLPFGPTVEVQLASSFVNRVTPANVGGMALNVRFMQKAGVPPAEAVTGMGLNVVAGGLVHIGLLVLFFAWAGQNGSGFSIPSSSKLLVAIAVILALVGVAMATRWGRKVMRSHVLPTLKQSMLSILSLGRSPGRLLGLFGGSIGVTLAYIAALACASAAFDTGVSFAQVGAVYLGASLIAAAAPTPGGLGAMEAALVAGFTGVGMDPALAVATVLSYRLTTFWLPILPGWLSFQMLDRKNYI